MTTIKTHSQSRRGIAANAPLKTTKLTLPS